MDETGWAMSDALVPRRMSDLEIEYQDAMARAVIEREHKRKQTEESDK